MKWKLFFAGGAASLLALVIGTMLSPGEAGAQAGERQNFQVLLLVPPDDKDYVAVKIPEGGRAVVTDVVAYNAADGKGHKVAPAAESYLWVGGYVAGRSVGLVNRMRVLGNETEQWHLQTGMELRGAPELLVSSEKLAANETPALVYVNGYTTR
jgi:hypothetical protein